MLLEVIITQTKINMIKRNIIAICILLGSVIKILDFDYALIEVENEFWKLLVPCLTLIASVVLFWWGESKYRRVSKLGTAV